MKKILIIVLMFMYGCSYSTYFLESGAKSYPATKIADVKFFSGKPEEPFTVIGCVASWAANKEESKSLLRQKAAFIGADAVIFIELNTLNTNSGGFGVSGVAVTFSH